MRRRPTAPYRSGWVCVRDEGGGGEETVNNTPAAVAVSDVAACDRPALISLWWGRGGGQLRGGGARGQPGDADIAPPGEGGGQMPAEWHLSRPDAASDENCCLVDDNKMRPSDISLERSDGNLS